MPLSAGMPWDQFELLEGVLSVPMWFGTAHTRVRLGRLPGSQVPVYCLEHHRYYDRPHLYGPPPDAYPDNLERFAFLSRGALELTKALREFEHFGTLNLTKAALYRSTLLTTVSRHYASEIQTPAYGCGFDGVLGERGRDLFGVTNGIDLKEWNPATDSHLPAHFDADDLGGKAQCKAALQQEAGLPIRPRVPLLALVTRRRACAPSAIASAPGFHSTTPAHIASRRAQTSS